MKATIEPLQGKYYGTKINFEYIGKRIEKGVIEVWHMGDYKPSKRQLQYWGVKSIKEAHDNDYPCDSHFETEITYKICVEIKNALENLTTSRRRLMGKIL